MDNINVDLDARVSHAAGREAKKLTHCNHHSTTGEDDANSKRTPLSEIATHADELVIRRKCEIQWVFDVRANYFPESRQTYLSNFELLIRPHFTLLNYEWPNIRYQVYVYAVSYHHLS